MNSPEGFARSQLCLLWVISRLDLLKKNGLIGGGDGVPELTDNGRQIVLELVGEEFMPSEDEVMETLSRMNACQDKDLKLMATLVLRWRPEEIQEINP